MYKMHHWQHQDLIQYMVFYLYCEITHVKMFHEYFNIIYVEDLFNLLFLTFRFNKTQKKTVRLEFK